MLELTTLQQIIFLTIFVLVAYTCFLRSGFSLAPWVPTAKKDLERVNRLAALQPGQTFFEVGCGDARVSLYIGKKNPEANIIAVEMSPLVFMAGKVRQLFSGTKNVKLRLGDALLYDMSTVDVVYTYALPKTVNNKLLPKIKKELRPGARLLSYAFKLEGDGLLSQDSVPDASTIYIFEQS